MRVNRPPPTESQAAAGSDATAEYERLLNKPPDSTVYQFRLFITGTTRRSLTAIANIREICQRFLGGRANLEVVDIYQQPAEARDKQIIAAPTLVRESPKPPLRMVGDLSDTKRVLSGLNLVPGVSTPQSTNPPQGAQS